jgi:peroxiredoxin Q/BCP
MTRLKTNDKAPQFSLQDASGKKVKLSDFKGKKVLLYFYPKADTPGCTTQACSIRDASKQFNRHKLAVLGISPDEPEKLSKFDQKYGLRFPLLSDPGSKVAKAYGAWGEKSMYGKKYEGILRSSFLLDEEGSILQAWYKVSPKNTVPNALKELK